MQENKEQNKNLPMILGLILIACLLIGVFVIPDMITKSTASTEFGLSDAFNLVN